MAGWFGDHLGIKTPHPLLKTGSLLSTCEPRLPPVEGQKHPGHGGL